ncbi:MAG: hypothetical protein D6736_14845 [Nitrospinota bacterium]|nr:MAG: hypothetical protein D6736_14845 [Nitrospinota bacterium]
MLKGSGAQPGDVALAPSILGTGRYLPETVLSNAALEQLFDTSDEKIIALTGIRERRIATRYTGPQGSLPSLLYEEISRDETPAAMGAVAALQALREANTLPDQIRYIVVGTNSPDQLYPATAIKIQRYLGAEQAVGFDLQAGCTAFIFALATACRYLIADRWMHGSSPLALVVGTDCMSRTISREDRTASTMFGDGAGAVVLGFHPERVVLRTVLHSAYSDTLMLDTQFQAGHGEAFREKREPSYLRMNGKAVFRQAPKLMVEALQEVLKEEGLSAGDLRYVITHQTNIRMIRRVAEMLQMDMAHFIPVSSATETPRLLPCPSPCTRPVMSTALPPVTTSP